MARSTISRRTLLTLPVALTAAGCAAPSVPSPVAAGAAAAAPAPWSTLDARRFAAALERPGTVVLDVRTPGEFAEGHLPGALNADVNSADFVATLGGLDKTVPYAVYCRSGSRSAVALDVMRQQGFSYGFHLEGGFAAWRAAGFPTASGA